MNEFRNVEKINPFKYILAVDIPYLNLEKGIIINERIKNTILANGIFVIPVYENKAYDMTILDEEQLNEGYYEIKNELTRLERNKYFDKKKLKEISDNISKKMIKNKENLIYLPLKKLQEYDEYTYTHSLNVCVVATLIARNMGLREKMVRKVSFSALIHDIGKTKISNEILNSPNKLNDEEFRIIKNHVRYGYEIALKNKIIDEDVLGGILYHHEKFDGKGYLYNKSDLEIPLVARIITIADVYDALTSKRSYKKPWNNYETISFIIQNVEKIFDKDIVSVFIKIIGLYPPGTKVMLNDYSVGTVVAARETNELQPLIQIGECLIDMKQENKYILKVFKE